jgi:hypothetical protein
VAGAAAEDEEEDEEEEEDAAGALLEEEAEEDDEEDDASVSGAGPSVCADASSVRGASASSCMGLSSCGSAAAGGAAGPAGDDADEDMRRKDWKRRRKKDVVCGTHSIRWKQRTSSELTSHTPVPRSCDQPQISSTPDCRGAREEQPPVFLFPSPLLFPSCQGCCAVCLPLLVNCVAWLLVAGRREARELSAKGPKRREEKENTPRNLQ